MTATTSTTTTVRPDRCCHCKRRKGSAGRGLCYTCWSDTTVREKYPYRPKTPRKKPEGYGKDLCVHCHLFPGWTRGLCCSCHRKPAIRCLYPLIRESRYVDVDPPRPTQDPEPTDAIPGSPEKITILRERLWSGQRLYHAKDARRNTR